MYRILHISYDSIYNKYLRGGGAFRLLETYREIPSDFNVTILTAKGLDEKAPSIYRFVGVDLGPKVLRITFMIRCWLHVLFHGYRYDLIIETYSCYSPIFVPLIKGTNLIILFIFLSS